MRVKGIFTFFLMAIMILPPMISFAGKKKHSDCDSEMYTCMRVKRNQSWESLCPDEREREIVMRVNHRNSQLWTGLKIKIPNNLETADLLDFSPFPLQIEPPEEKLVVFDPKLHAWGAYEADGALVRWGPATGGKNWC